MIQPCSTLAALERRVLHKALAACSAGGAARPLSATSEVCFWASTPREYGWRGFGGILIGHALALISDPVIVIDCVDGLGMIDFRDCRERQLVVPLLAGRPRTGPPLRRIPYAPSHK
jgi:hypothetical protein